METGHLKRCFPFQAAFLALAAAGDIAGKASGRPTLE
jgi:hypothetical protein